jgi:hypothetical protein
MSYLQVTIAGIDPSGFVFNNVFHLRADVGAGTFFTLLSDTANEINATVIPVYQAAANDQVKFLDIGVKGIGADASYTFHKKIAVSGTRAVTPNLGAVSPLIRFVPESGTLVGGMYVVGASVDDFVGDEIQPAYQALLSDLGNIMISYNSSIAPRHYQLITYSHNGTVISELKHKITPTRPTTLNKRMRA